MTSTVGVARASSATKVELGFDRAFSSLRKKELYTTIFARGFYE